jgi:hypothetical protein
MRGWVQIFDATVQDNRHIRLTGLKQREWTTTHLDFSRDARRNDGTGNSPFAAGNKVDDLFFFVTSARGGTCNCLWMRLFFMTRAIGQPWKIRRRP